MRWPCTMEQWIQQSTKNTTHQKLILGCVENFMGKMIRWKHTQCMNPMTEKYDNEVFTKEKTKIQRTKSACSDLTTPAN